MKIKCITFEKLLLKDKSIVSLKNESCVTNVLTGFNGENVKQSEIEFDCN